MSSPEQVAKVHGHTTLRLASPQRYALLALCVCVYVLPCFLLFYEVLIGSLCAVTAFAGCFCTWKRPDITFH